MGRRDDPNAVLIDDTGTIWPARRDIFSVTDALPRRNRELAVEAISRGWIFLRPIKSAMFVGIHPHFATNPSLYRLYRLLIDHKPTRVIISSDRRLSFYELATSASRAIVRIEEIIADARRPQPRPLLTETRLPLDQVGKFAQARFLPLLKAWEEAHHQWQPNFYDWLRDNRYLAYSRIVRMSRGSERLRIEYWGSNRAVYDKDWSRVAKGRDFEEQPNIDIAMWRAAMFRQISAAGQPWLGSNDLVTQRADGGIVRLQLRRLVLPWQCDDGDVMLSAIHANPRTVVMRREDA